MPCVTTCSGRSIDLINPDPDEIKINEIAHHLSLINRFNGATEYPYSVAQHSYIVSHIVGPQFALLALLHDAAEAFLGDIVHPVKQSISGFVGDFERPLLDVILTKYGVEADSDSLSCIDSADMQARATEFRDLFETPQKQDALPEPLDYRIVPVDYRRAKTIFLNRFHYLTEGRFQSE